MMRYKTKQAGFTLLELLVVIAIIGVLASVVIISVQETNRLGRNTGVLKQMYEYQTALDTYYLVEGNFPSGHTNPVNPVFRRHMYCIGDEFVPGSACTPLSRTDAEDSSVEQVLVPEHIGRIRHIDYGLYSSPAYRGCSDLCTVTSCGNTACSTGDYSLFYVLEGVNEDCGRGTQIHHNYGSSGFTWCQLRESRN